MHIGTYIVEMRQIKRDASAPPENMNTASNRLRVPTPHMLVYSPDELADDGGGNSNDSQATLACCALTSSIHMVVLLREIDHPSPLRPLLVMVRPDVMDGHGHSPSIPCFITSMRDPDLIRVMDVIINSQAHR